MRGDATGNERGSQSNRQAAMAATGLGLNFAVAVALFSYLGHQLDQRRGGGRAWTLAGVLLGLLYGGYEVWKLVRSGSDKASPP
jgi:hypothetical protein